MNELIGTLNASSSARNTNMRMLILGTGGMANQHAKHFAAIDGVTLVGGVDVDPNRLDKFNATHNIPNGFASLDAAIAC